MTTTVDDVADLLVHHQRAGIGGCHCGWSELGRSYTAHLAVVLDEAGLLRAPAPDPESVAAAETPRWRAGHQVPEHLYRDEQPVATMPAHVVAEVVAAMGGGPDPLGAALAVLVAAVAEVRSLHINDGYGQCAVCCDPDTGNPDDWPCATERAITDAGATP